MPTALNPPMSFAAIARTGKARGEPAEPLSADAGGENLPGIADLWRATLGEEAVCLAVLDGPVDLSHPSLHGANLKVLGTAATGATSAADPAAQHGTHITSLIFGRHPGPPKGLAPRCRGVIMPIFSSDRKGLLRPCSQLDLARGMTLAIERGAQIINISGGQFSPSTAAWPLLEGVVKECARRGILIIAAAGNEGCECWHIPAALDTVLAVGAMDSEGRPLAFSNWGAPYQGHGILAPGQGIVGARAGGGLARRSGTSCAAALVSGVAALLCSLQVRHRRRVHTQLVRQALLASALGCEYQPIPDCRLLLAGRLNVKGAVSLLIQGMHPMSEPNAMLTSAEPSGQLEQGANGSPAPAPPALTQGAAAAETVSPAAVSASACACPCAGPGPQLVYALGRLGYDFISEARMDSLLQKMAGHFGVTRPEQVRAFDPERLLAYLDEHPWDAAAIEWTLTVDGTPVYALRPHGPFAADVYARLRKFVRQQLTEGAERISVPGVAAGQASLLMGQVVPVLVPELRGMYSWTTGALVEAVVGPAPAAGASPQETEGHQQRQQGVRDFLDRVYHEVRNLGLLPQDRALNFAATNAFAIEKVYESAIKEKMELDAIQLVRSPICRPHSDCWDVELYFFYPDRQVQTVRKVYRFTVDVSDTVPVTVGTTRSWFTR